jgi:hypothetical protein
MSARGENGRMDVDDLRRLLSPEGLRLLDEVGELEQSADVVRTVSRLRAAGHDGGLVAAVLEQARLRSRARSKFGDFADRMLFTPAGLEQATRLRVAALHAGRFAEAGVDVVADLGCGIGADAMALAAMDLGVVAVERDELTAAVAAFNLAPFPSARVELGDAEAADLAGVGAVWLDPARRDGATRFSDPRDWSPSLEWAFDLARRLPSGIKLGPGLDRDLIPDDVEAQWVSVDRDVVELVLWSGSLARPGIRRAATVIGPASTSSRRPPTPPTPTRATSPSISSNPTAPSSAPGSSATSPAVSRGGCSTPRSPGSRRLRRRTPRSVRRSASWSGFRSM